MPTYSVTQTVPGVGNGGIQGVGLAASPAQASVHALNRAEVISLVRRVGLKPFRLGRVFVFVPFPRMPGDSLILEVDQTIDDARVGLPLRRGDEPGRSFIRIANVILKMPKQPTKLASSLTVRVLDLLRQESSG
jgi:hypothetical protein